MNGKPSLYAVLIGIDCYLPNVLPDGTWYPNLSGCVRDVGHVEDFLQRKLAMPQGNITKLTSTFKGATEPPEPPAQWPTGANMVAAFKKVTGTANKGDLVYIHYSGHGGRASTIWPKLKGDNGLDEGLVPLDIGNSAASYLRDVELAHLVQTMVEKGLVVVLVLDCCHSGGMARGRADVAVRGINSIDTSKRPAKSLVAAKTTLTKTWQNLTAHGTRDVSVGSGWLPQPQGYTLLAACRPSESAYEYAFNGYERNGALTYWMLDSLQDIGPGLTYKVLQDRLVAKVHSQFEQQTPQLQGEGDRVVFGSDHVRPVYAANVMQVDPAKNRLLLNAGQAQNLRLGSLLAVYPRGTLDVSDLQKRLAVAELAEVGAVDSWAAIVKKLMDKAIEQGDQALLLSPGSTKLVRRVSLVQRADLPPDIEQQAALHAVEQALVGNPWVELATDNKSIDYQVVLNAAGAYEVWDCSGQPINNLRPALAAGDVASAAKVVGRLVHMAKYNALRQLRNNDALSPLARRLQVQLAGTMDEYDPVDPFVPQPFAEAGGAPTLTVGQWTALRITNNSTRKLNITVLDLRPAWGVMQVYPSDERAFEEYEPGYSELIPLQASLPDAYDEGTDVLKVFATVGTTTFRWLELPSLDEPMKRSAAVRGRSPANPLEELVSAFSAARPPTRDLIPCTYPSKEWVTEQVEIHMRKA